jgi:glycosyltransferase involved in cell wall biosynthesis
MMTTENPPSRRIALVGPAYPLRGGIAQYMAILYQKLVQRGHQVLFVSFRKQFPKLLFPGTTQLESSQDLVPVKSIRLFTPWNIGSWWRSARAIRQFQPDLIVFKWWMPFFGPGFGTLSRWAIRRTATRILYIVDNAIPHEPRPGDKALTHWAFGPVQYFIAQSETVLHDMKTIRPDLDDSRLRLVHHPIYDCYDHGKWTQETARQELGITESRVMLFFGYIRRYKGLRVLIEALPYLAERFRDDYRLLVVGEFYEGRDDILHLIDNLDVRARILLVDRYVPNEEVELYFRAADVAILPYESATQSGIIQVAHDFDLPVITTNVGGLPEVVSDGKTGCLVPPGDPEALAGKVIDFYENNWGSKFKEAIGEEKERFSWKPLVDAVEAAAGPSGWAS